MDNLQARVILVYISSFQKRDELNWNVQELSSLAVSAEMKVIDVIISNCTVFNAKYCIGIGKILEIKQIVQDKFASVVLFNNTLLPRQESNLTCLLQCKVMDRYQLILNIFAQRARTYEGKLQVQLAHLRYLNSRLIHEWSHLERQKGGIGLRSGPGEMQLENDRRMLRQRIARSISYLKKIENQREQSRKNRFRIGMPIVSLVGYTNAGKSTLFNILTASRVYTAEKLFSTLDPSFRRITYQGVSNAILVDTVGFIQNLPDDLISSFKVTLKEIMASTLLLHVVDASNKKFERNIDTVHDLLNDLNIRNIPLVLVMNKVDKLKKLRPCIDRDYEGRPIRVWISSKNCLGMSLLAQVLNELLLVDVVHYELRLPISNDLCQTLYRLQAVQKYWIEDSCNIRLKINLPAIAWNRLLKRNKSLINYVV